MGESDRYQEYKKLAPKKFYLGTKNNALMALVSLNAVFFLLLLLLQVVYFFYNQSADSYNQSVVKWFELPYDIHIFFRRPWTLFTFMFSDTSVGLWRLLSNLFWLWTFGTILRGIAGNEKVMPIYIYGGLLSGVFFLVFNIFDQSTSYSFIGANSSILALAASATTLSPRHRVLTHIRKGVALWILFVIYLAIDIIGIQYAKMVLVFSHLMGASAGVIFALFLRKGIDGSIWMNTLYDGFMNLFTPKVKAKRNIDKDKLFYAAGNRTPYIKSPKSTQERVDEILDKINAKGFQCLTEEEKQFLQNASKDETL